MFSLFRNKRKPHSAERILKLASLFYPKNPKSTQCLPLLQSSYTRTRTKLTLTYVFSLCLTLSCSHPNFCSHSHSLVYISLSLILTDTLTFTHSRSNSYSHSFFLSLSLELWLSLLLSLFLSHSLTLTFPLTLTVAYALPLFFFIILTLVMRRKMVKQTDSFLQNSEKGIRGNLKTVFKEKKGQESIGLEEKAFWRDSVFLTVLIPTQFCKKNKRINCPPFVHRAHGD